MPYRFALVFALALPAASQAADTVVRIGSVSPVSGPSAHLGKDTENGARLAVADLNAKGIVINGRKVRGRAPQFGHHGAGLEDLSQCRHTADHALGHDAGVHAPGLQVGLSRGGER